MALALHDRPLVAQTGVLRIGRRGGNALPNLALGAQGACVFGNHA